MPTRNLAQFLGAFLAIFSPTPYAESYAPVQFSSLYNKADQVRLVRVVAVEMQEGVPNECQFKYRVKTLSNFKGETSKEIYSSSGAYVGSIYLILGKVSPTCSNSGIAISNLPFSSIFPLVPYASYLFNYPDEQVWLAFGGSEIEFPDDIRVTDSSGCYARFERDSVMPCPVPLPAANWADLKRLLERLSNRSSAELKGTHVDNSNAHSFGSVYSGRDICRNYIKKMVMPINERIAGMKTVEAKRQSFVSLPRNPLVQVILDVRSSSVLNSVDPQRSSHSQYIIDLFSKKLERIPNFERARCGVGEGREEILNSLYFGTSDKGLRSRLQAKHPHWRTERWELLVSLLAPSLVSEPQQR